MANLTAVSSFDDVFQLETTTVALGGAGGIMNAQAQALLNRTFYLKGLCDSLAAMLEPTINTQSGTSYILQAVDNDGKTYLRMTSSSANTVTIPSNQTLPISITQRGTGTTTLVADSGVTLNGTLAFSAQHQTKSVIPVGSNAFDVVG